MLGWFKKTEDDVGRLIARKKYREAGRELRRQLNESPGSVQLRQRLAEVLVLERKTLEALRLLGRLAEELADNGFRDKAIAVIKKMRRINPDLESLEERLAALMGAGDPRLATVPAVAAPALPARRQPPRRAWAARGLEVVVERQVFDPTTGSP